MESKELRKARKLKDKAVRFIEKGKFGKALDIYADLREANPKDPSLVFKSAELNRRLKKNDVAISLYAEAAELYGRDGMLVRGIAVCKVILDIDPSHRESQERLADLYLKNYGSLPKKKGALPIETPLLESASEPDPSEKETDTENEVVVEIDLSEMETDTPQKEENKAEDAIIVSDAKEDEDNIEQMSEEPPLDEALPHIPLFSDLDRESFVELLNHVSLRTFAKGEKILKEGEEGDSFFIIVNGSVRVIKDQDLNLAKLDSGAFFGEMALVSSRPRQASVWSLEPTEVLEISKSQLLTIAKAYPQILVALRRFTDRRLLHNLMLTSPLFTPFGLEERKNLMRLFKRQTVKKGQVIIEQGVPSKGLYLIVSGTMTVVRKTGEEVEPVATLVEGDMAGEVSVLTHSNATATVRALGTTRILCLSKQTFNELIMTHPQILMLVSEVSESRQKGDETASLHRPRVSSIDGGSAPL